MRYLTEQDEAKRKEAFKQMDRFRQIEDAVYDHLVSLKIDMKNLYEHKDCLYVRGWGKDPENPRMGIPTTGKRIMTLKQYDELINKIKSEIDARKQN
jgi:hypothetical protein